MFTTRIRPKESVKPLASKKSSAASETPFNACRTALVNMQNQGQTGVCPGSVPGLALIGPVLEEFLGLPLPELRHVLVGLDRHVGEHLAQHRVLDLLDARDVD